MKRTISVFVEGGGKKGRHGNGSAALRKGFNALLRHQQAAALDKGFEWELAMCGGGAEAIKAFCDAACRKSGDILALLVDSEAPVENSAPRGRVAHLVRHDKAQGLLQVDPSAAHLMTQSMEAWIIADCDALEKYYGSAFAMKPHSHDRELDDLSTSTLLEVLKKATAGTPKKAYRKVDNSAELLRTIRPEIVARYCASFRHFVCWLDAVIEAS